jgi:Zn-finger nucleic acid-binding protein
MTERQGVEIDYCPQCRGIWLDRGELDRIIERSILERRLADSGSRSDERNDKYYEKDKEKHHGEYNHHKKRSFLRDLLD